MSLMIASCALLIVSCAALAPHYDVATEWSSFKRTYSKGYSSMEESYRFSIFRTNLEFIALENSKNHTYTLGVTQFADKTLIEFEAQYFPKAAQPRAAPDNSSLLGEHRWSGENLPESVDWQKAGATTPIQDENQNGCYGACWAFAAAGAIEGIYFINVGRLVPLSEQQFVDCSSQYGNHGCNGGLMDYAYSYAMHHPLCSRESYPYHGPTVRCEETQCDVEIPANTVQGHKQVHGDEQSLMSAVAQQPVTVAVQGAWTDTNAFRFYTGGVLSADCGDAVDHGVLVVGYGNDDTGGDYWIIKNSYGTDWGMEGYAWLARGKGGKGECGLLGGALSYPVLN